MHRVRILLWMWDSLVSAHSSSPQPCYLTHWAQCAIISLRLWIVLDRQGQRLEGAAGQCHHTGPRGQWTGTSCLLKRHISLLNGSRDRQQKSRPPIFLVLLWDFSECVIIAIHSSANCMGFMRTSPHTYWICWDGYSGHYLSYCLTVS